MIPNDSSILQFYPQGDRTLNVAGLLDFNHRTSGGFAHGYAFLFRGTIESEGPPPSERPLGTFATTISAVVGLHFYRTA
jgi:hypothetical protein